MTAVETSDRASIATPALARAFSARASFPDWCATSASAACPPCSSCRRPWSPTVSVGCAPGVPTREEILLPLGPHGWFLPCKHLEQARSQKHESQNIDHAGPRPRNRCPRSRDLRPRPDDGGPACARAPASAEL